MNIKLIEYDKEYLEYIKKWEEQKEIYEYLTNLRPKYLRKNFSEIREATRFYMIQYEDVIIGATWLEGITKEDAKLTIYIGEKEYRKRGIGTIVVDTLVNIAFDEINLKKVHLYVRANNSNAINCYKKLGFKIKRQFERQKFKNGSTQGSYEMVKYKK
ncbi:MAG: GNAT family N-acetyltransferase [Anaeromicrobium sp.]|jgi:RimJ/RimL family protein N-acetyltransferase|uniref:GNAT family N-acetyltransferase n=1 Tax=Anaeromicrobium sp. TaxID=1929132 RepID=UPI0025DB1A04|nr:GNAT family N-acetyltransferase [Anaeromicrobium sp.]MCT4595846.1 GNAT family N-acetyltransferase [Anaeromicrobium sp.]